MTKRILAAALSVVMIVSLIPSGVFSAFAESREVTESELTFSVCVHNTEGVNWTVTAPSTCGEDGEKVKFCTLCGAIAETSVIPATGEHELSGWVETIPATCGSCGEETRTCLNGCGFETTNVLPALEHEMSDWVTEVPVSCGTNGRQIRTCLNGCGLTYTNIISAFGHSYDDESDIVCNYCNRINGVLDYYVEWDHIVIAGCDSEYSGILAIPSYVDGLPVTTIGGYAFASCTEITEIIFPETLNYIGWAAFQGCIGLEKVNIPKDVYRIEELAFYSCFSVEEINVAEENNNYYSEGDCLIEAANGKLLFGCQNSVIPEGVVSIDEYAFLNCYGLTEINFPSSLREIENYAFSCCFGLTEVYIPGTVQIIGEGAFEDCYNLTDVTIEDGVSIMGNYTFQNCSSLQNVRLPSTVTRIVYGQFQGCNFLQNIELPETIEKIDSSAFAFCYNLDSIVVPEGITNIGNFAFQYCEGLTNITLPLSLTTIGKESFGYCYSLSDVYYAGNEEDRQRISYDNGNEYLFDANWIYAGDGGCAHEYDGSFDMDCNLCGKIKNILSYEIFDGEVTITSLVQRFSGHLVIPETIEGYPVTRIGYTAFTSCYDLTSINIPEGVTSIGWGAFGECYSLVSVNIPHGVTSIEDRTFAECHSLINIVIPEGVTSIGWSAFGECYELTSVTLPKSVTSIEGGAFGWCSSLTDVYYGGSEADKREIYIENDEWLLNATWHYAEGCAHEYDNEFDPDCNICGEEREVGTDTVFYVTSSGAQRGESVTVLVNAGNVDADALSVKAKFDKNVLKATNIEKLQDVGMMSIVNDTDNANIRGIVSFDMVDTANASFSDGALCAVTFEVKDAAAYGDSAITLEVIMSKDGNEYYDYITVDGKVCVHNIENSDWVVKTYATCTEAGVKEKFCSNCGALCETAEIDPLGHDYEGAEWIVTTHPTWETEGSKYRVCTRDNCGNIDEEVMPMATVESVELTTTPENVKYYVTSNGVAQFDPAGMVLTVYYSDYDVPTVVTDFENVSFPEVNVTEINPELEYTFAFAGKEVTLTLSVEGKFGDIDNNKTVNILDVRSLLVAVNSGTSGDIPKPVGDIDGNGVINVLDVRGLLVGVNSGTIR